MNRRARTGDLRLADVAALAVRVLRTRPVRVALSATGVALGIATMVGVLAVSASYSMVWRIPYSAGLLRKSAGSYAWAGARTPGLVPLAVRRRGAFSRSAWLRLGGRTEGPHVRRHAEKQELLAGRGRGGLPPRADARMRVVPSC